MSLGLNIPPLSGPSSYGSSSYSPYLPPSEHKSAGLAFGLSLLIPGAGQFYCGKIVRGALTLGFWILGLLFCFSGSQMLLAAGLGTMFVLWLFAFVDAYLTAIEVSQGLDEVVDVQNPRVAVVLNLLTSGFGYFYLGERTKGIVTFAVFQLIRVLILTKVSGIASTVISTVLLLLQLAMAADAYRIATRQLKEALGVNARPEATPAIPAPEQAQIPFAYAQVSSELTLPAPQTISPTPPGSRLPKEVPLALAGLLAFGFIVFAIIGTVLAPFLSPKNARMAHARPRQYLRAPSQTIPQTAPQTIPQFTPQSTLNPVPLDDSVPIKAVDFATAVLDVRRVQRRGQHTKDDLPSLTQDVHILNSVVDASKAVPVDETIARYNRAMALAQINMVHENDGEPMDPAVAHKARADLDKIINGPSLMNSPGGITLDNAEYWAGYVARYQLHDDKAAYAYWEKCASDTHAGCISNLAEAHITGAGGEAVDARQALDLLSTVYNSGLKYNCAGALSALNIAEIGYFMGVRRPGDDDLEWIGKSDELWNRLASGRNNRNFCLRAENEIEEFLVQLGHGHRDDNILQDALSRLDDDAIAPKAVIQYIAGAIDEPAMLARVQADKSQDLRCEAYFDVAWYTSLHNETDLSRRYYQRMVDIGKIHCGVNLTFAGKLNR